MVIHRKRQKIVHLPFCGDKNQLCQTSRSAKGKGYVLFTSSNSFGSSFRSQTLPGDKATLCSCLPGSHRPGGGPWGQGGRRYQPPPSPSPRPAAAAQGWQPHVSQENNRPSLAFHRDLDKGFWESSKQLSVRIDLLISEKSESKRTNCRSAVLHQPDTSKRPEIVRPVWSFGRRPGYCLQRGVPHFTCKVRKRELNCREAI